MTATYNVHVSGERLDQFYKELSQQAEQRRFDPADLVMMAAVCLHLATKDGPREMAIERQHSEHQEAIKDEFLDALQIGGVRMVIDILRAFDANRFTEKFDGAFIHARVVGAGASHDEMMAGHVEYVSGKKNS